MKEAGTTLCLCLFSMAKTEIQPTIKAPVKKIYCPFNVHSAASNPVIELLREPYRIDLIAGRTDIQTRPQQRRRRLWMWPVQDYLLCQHD